MNIIFSNEIIVVSFLGWFIAQSLKIFSHFAATRKVDFSRMVGSGGMPSSHSPLVASMTTAIGILDGFGSSVFALSLGMACIVMYDASGVRLAVGKQAKILNEILEDIQKHKFETEKLKELIGHTPLQVFAGAILGVAIALIYFTYR